MFLARRSPRLVALIAASVLAASSLTSVNSRAVRAQAGADDGSGRKYPVDTRRALAARPSRAVADKAATNTTNAARAAGHTPTRERRTLPTRPVGVDQVNGTNAAARRRPSARPAERKAELNTTQANGAVITTNSTADDDARALTVLNTRVRPGTSLARVLHTAQLSTNSSAGSDEQYVDRNYDLAADERTTFDSGTLRGGSFDVAVGRTGTRYEDYSGIDDRGTITTNDDMPIGVLVAAFDTNGDFVRDASTTYDLRTDFSLRSAVAVVAGTSRAGREFVAVSSSGYYNASNPNDPDNEPTAGVALLVRDPATGGFDSTRSRQLVRVGDQRLNNANALALLPNNDLLIADFDSDELRVVRDTDNDGLPDTLDPVPYYSYRFSNDAPLDLAVNSRGVVFSHSAGNNAVLLALYDDNGDGRADADEEVVTGLSLDNNLILHGLTVDREGTVYIIEDAQGASDRVADGGNGGAPIIQAFPDPGLSGLLLDGAIFAAADNPNTQALSGLAFGVDQTLGAVARLSLVNSASLRAPATYDGLASIVGNNFTRGRSGTTPAAAAAQGIQVAVEGRYVPVQSFADGRINLYVPAATGAGTRSVVVYVDGNVIAADDVTIAAANPGLFTAAQDGAGEAVALYTAGLRYTTPPFPARTDGQPSSIALFGTGWRNNLPVSVTVGGRATVVDYAGASGGFNGLDQINLRLPDGVTGVVPVIITTTSGATSRADVTIRIN